MYARSPSPRNVVAVLIATTAALIGRAWLQVELVADGMPRDYAADLAYLVVPPILLLLLFPVLHMDRPFLAAQFAIRDLSPRLVVRALLAGVALRALWWAKTTAGVSFGFYRNDDPMAVEGPAFAFDCGTPQAVLLGLVVMSMMVPLIEEITHRAYVQTSLRRYGWLVAIPCSATAFAVFHPPSSWEFVFFGGLVLGAQYWLTGSLWSSLITHATVNGLIQFDWRCLNTQWNPRPEDLPLWYPGIVACVIAVACLCMLYALMRPEK